jgi:hypothetical protein
MLTYLVATPSNRCLMMTNLPFFSPSKRLERIAMSENSQHIQPILLVLPHSPGVTMKNRPTE